MAATATTPRKRTSFLPCSVHKPFFASVRSRERKAEFFSEGGPASGPPCTPGSPCRMRAGTDLYLPEVCVGDYPLDWAVNRKITS